MLRGGCALIRNEVLLVCSFLLSEAEGTEQAREIRPAIMETANMNSSGRGNCGKLP